MDFTEDWKSLWPTSSTFSAPLFISSKGSDAPFGPLIFNPDPNSSTMLLHSPSSAPCLPPQYPQLPLSQFLQNCHSVPSPASSVSSLIGSVLPKTSPHFHGFNALQMLQIPSKNLIILFYPTGENSDRVGVLLLSVKDGKLNAQSQRENCFQVVKEGNMNHQLITRLLVNPVDDSFGYEDGNTVFGDSHNANHNNNAVMTVGYLMICTDYSVNWYRVGIRKDHRQNEYIVALDYLGCADARMLRGNAVVGACWSPHLNEECLVLLENGDLLLFDVDYSSRIRDRSKIFVNSFVVGKRMKISLNDKVGLVEESGDKEPQWFGCEFSWHPRIFITYHQKEVFLIDSRSAGECNVCSLLKLEALSTYKNDGFFALSTADPDRFIFVVATKKLLLLCDVRKPLMPVLRWGHGIQNPRYIAVFGLLELRANAKDTKYKLASESGYCVMLGSFWDREFGLFCYGPNLNRNGSVYSEISKFCNTYYAWGHPSELSLSGSDCNCGSCVVNEEFWKESLLAWIDWRQKKCLSLGFGILHPDLYAQLSLADNFGGFILIRLTSSGKVETQHYSAAWKPERTSLIGHKRKGIHFFPSEEDNLLYDPTPSEYDGKKKFQHLKLEYLNAYLKDNLAELVVTRRQNTEKSNQGSPVKQQLDISDSIFHHEMCNRLKNFGLPRDRSSRAISDVMKDITTPTSIRDIALRSIYAALPTNLLQQAFSTYTDFKEDSYNYNEPLEFLGVPNDSQLPPCTVRKPSDRSNRWSRKIQPTEDVLVGPIIPPPVLATLHKIYTEELEGGTKPYLEESETFSASAHFRIHCNKVMDIIQEHVSSSGAKAENDDCVSLADDTDDISCAGQKMKLSYHKAPAFLEHPLRHMDEHREFSTHVFRRNQELTSDIGAEIVGEEIFDVGCPIQLKFDNPVMVFSPKELEAFKKMKKQDLNFQKSFKPYQDYINQGCELK